ncbi:MAG: glycosyltransferase [Myxococcota bacterium]
MSLISIIIPNHNYGRFVGAAVESALAQSYRDIEVVVVDNGSTDNSVEILRQYQSRIKLITQENRGQAEARNRGIIEASGKYFAFLDADDVWLPHKLESQIKLMNSPEIGLVYSGCMKVDQDLNPEQAMYPKYTGRVLKQFASGIGAVVIAGESTSLIRRECIERCGLLDPNLSTSSGWDLYRRIATRYAFAAVFEPLVLYRQHGDNWSLRTKVFETDWLYCLKKMFDDENAAAVHHLEAACFKNAYRALTITSWRAGRKSDATKFLGRYLWQTARKSISL